MRKIILIVFFAALFLLPPAAFADQAEDLTRGCSVSVVDNNYAVDAITDGKYPTYWESTTRKNPWVEIRSGKPVYGLYLCFNKMPSSYAIQRKSGDDWIPVTEEGNPQFHHIFYELNGEETIRIISTEENESVMAFNEIFAFGEGEIPDWVQRWEPPVEKADLMVFIAHPDDEMLFFGGTIPTYAGEKKKKVEVVYITYSNKVRRSEALNGLWEMGVRNYPEFGPFADRYPETGELSDSYILAGGKEKVQEWLTGVFRKYRPDVVVTHAVTGEYGHPQHKMAADSSKDCFTLAADPESFPVSASAYGTWQVKKLYLHLYGEEGDQTVFDWDVPMDAFGGRTGAQVASDAFALHVTQKGAGVRRKGEYVEFTVEVFGAKYYPYNVFGLYSSTVGEDEAKNDFLEHIPEN